METEELREQIRETKMLIEEGKIGKKGLRKKASELIDTVENSPKRDLVKICNAGECKGLLVYENDNKDSGLMISPKSIYEGGLRNSVPHGKGNETCCNDLSYLGEYRNGSPLLIVRINKKE